MVHATHRRRMMPPAHARRARRHTLVTFLAGVAVLAAALFAWLANAVMNHALIEPNTALELSVHAQATPTLDTFFKLLTHVGSVPV
ncbi:MAG: hypothetical protein JWM80_2320, partial [Cyanobacteria bacterium RYN_339]|nr:hypothetical protein [Cyanobacteria bacterium RYN_339]